MSWNIFSDKIIMGDTLVTEMIINFDMLTATMENRNFSDIDSKNIVTHDLSRAGMINPNSNRRYRNQIVPIIV